METMTWKKEDDKQILNVSEPVEKITRQARVFPPSEDRDWWRWTVVRPLPGEIGFMNHPGCEYAMGNAETEEEAKAMAKRQLELSL